MLTISVHKMMRWIFFFFKKGKFVLFNSFIYNVCVWTAVIQMSG